MKAAETITSSLSKLQSLNGLFAIYKKRGPTSADVLNALKEALLKEAGEQNPNPRKRKKQSLKIGHGGTLDSAASGVLGKSVVARLLSAPRWWWSTCDCCHAAAGVVMGFHPDT
uniref:TruB pseudouridine (psi) synthase family member 1 n=1 Tax=Monopterus albus TaxID=43700 RepID=A0A3Q3J861_MONAL